MKTQNEKVEINNDSFKDENKELKSNLEAKELQIKKKLSEEFTMQNTENELKLKLENLEKKLKITEDELNITKNRCKKE